MYWEFFELDLCEFLIVILFDLFCFWDLENFDCFEWWEFFDLVFEFFFFWDCLGEGDLDNGDKYLDLFWLWFFFIYKGLFLEISGLIFVVLLVWVVIGIVDSLGFFVGFVIGIVL